MKKLLIKLLDKLIQRDKEPYIFFTCNGLGDDGRIKFEMLWNKAFIANMTANGINGTTEQETAMLFLVGSQLRPEELCSDTINSEAHPLLASEANTLRRG